MEIDRPDSSAKVYPSKVKDVQKLMAFAVIAKQTSYKKAHKEFLPLMKSKVGKECLDEILKSSGGIFKNVQATYERSFEKLYRSDYKHAFKNFDHTTQANIIKNTAALAKQGILHPDINDLQEQLAEFIAENNKISKENAELKIENQTLKTKNKTLTNYLSNLQANVSNTFKISKDQINEMTMNSPAQLKDRARGQGQNKAKKNQLER